MQRPHADQAVHNADAKLPTLEELRQNTLTPRSGRLAVLLLACAVAVGWFVTLFVAGLWGLAVGFALGITVILAGLWIIIRPIEQRSSDFTRLIGVEQQRRSPSTDKLLLGLWCYLLVAFLPALMLCFWVYLNLGTWFAGEAGASIGFTWLVVATAVTAAIIDTRSTAPLPAPLFQRITEWVGWSRAVKYWGGFHLVIILPYLLASAVGVYWGKSAGQNANVLVYAWLVGSSYMLERRRKRRAAQMQ